MNTLLLYKGTRNTIFRRSISEYQSATTQRAILNNKPLNKGQIQFLKYPYLTSVFWAKRRREKVKTEFCQFYYAEKQPQLKLFAGL